MPPRSTMLRVAHVSGPDELSEKIPIHYIVQGAE